MGLSRRLAEVRVGSRTLTVELFKVSPPIDIFRIFSVEISRRHLMNAHPTTKLSLILFDKNILFVEVSDSRIKYLDP